MLLTAISIITIIKSNDKKEIQKDIKSYEVDKKQFAMYVENEEGKYSEYTSSNIFPVGYKINLTKSNCVDTKGNKIDGILSGTSNSVTITSNKTAYCYIYFDIDYVLSELCKNGDNLGSCLTTNNEEIDSLDDTAYAEMYRYTGTSEIVDDNYICFGTTNKNECINNSDKYMYRIVGITSEDNETLGLEAGQVKLIKNTSIGTYQWNTSNSNIVWEDSPMYIYLHGSEVLGNDNIISNAWSNKIDNVKWNVGDVQTWTDGLTIYELEDNMKTTKNAKLGLIYLSDYYYAYNSGGTHNCVNPYCENWISMEIEDIMWTMTRYGYYSSNNDYAAWNIRANGSLGYPCKIYSYEIRPVFYLNQDEVFASGIGTTNDPIIIRENASETLLSNPTKGLDITTPYSGMYRYTGTEANNYVKLSDGTNETIYRIIGIVSEDNETLGLQAGQIKLLKDEDVGSMYWYDDDTIDIKWEKSLIYEYLQNTILNNTVHIPSGWPNKIVSVKWNVGNDVTTWTNGNTIYNLESSKQTANFAKLGLIYLSDYYYAYNSGGTTNCVENNCINWMTSSSYFWTMIRRGFYSPGNYHLVMNILETGYVSSNNFRGGGVIRPVFYLSKDVYITNPTATGTSTDPFILSY